MPLVPAGIKGTDGSARLAPARRGTGSRWTSTTCASSSCTRPRASRPTAYGRDPRARGDRLNGAPLLVDRRRLARSSRLSRAPQVHRGAGGRPTNALVGFSNFLLRLWDAEQPRAVLVGWDILDDADLPPRGARGVSVGPCVRRRAPRAARHCSPGSSRLRVRVGEGAGIRGRRLPRRRGRRGGERPVLVATSDRDAFQLVSDRVRSSSR